MSNSRRHGGETDVELPRLTDDARFTRLEVEQENIRGEVRRLSINVDQGFRRIEDSFSSLTSRVAARDKTNWSTLASWAGVILAVVGLFAQGPMRDIARVEATGQRHIEEATRAMIENATKNADQDANIKYNAERIKDLDAVLQREMRLLLDAATLKSPANNK